MRVCSPLHSSWFTNNASTYYKTHFCCDLTYQNEMGIISHSQRPCVCMHHNIIQIHNNVMWDWQYSTWYLDGMWEYHGIFCGILSVSHNIVMDLNYVMVVPFGRQSYNNKTILLLKHWGRRRLLKIILFIIKVNVLIHVKQSYRSPLLIMLTTEPKMYNIFEHAI
jgi:hypothetical protein